jgi:hypothetical protein
MSFQDSGILHGPGRRHLSQTGQQQLLLSPKHSPLPVSYSQGLESGVSKGTAVVPLPLLCPSGWCLCLAPFAPAPSCPLLACSLPLSSFVLSPFSDQIGSFLTIGLSVNESVCVCVCSCVWESVSV